MAGARIDGRLPVEPQIIRRGESVPHSLAASIKSEIRWCRMVPDPEPCPVGFSVASFFWTMSSHGMRGEVSTSHADAPLLRTTNHLQRVILLPWKATPTETTDQNVEWAKSIASSADFACFRNL